MEKLDEVLDLLRTATPMLEEFIAWKQQEAEREKQAAFEQSESEKEFAKWLKQRQAEEAQQQADAEELKKDFYGGERWKKEHLFPKPY
jgi:metal-dependent amidase/aminoacylase/carboxypeptidase family protein